MKKRQTEIILFIMCLLLTIGICVQINTINNATIGSGKTIAQNELKDEVLKTGEKYKRTTEELEKSQKELEGLIESISKEDDGSGSYSQRLEKLNNILGYNSLKGPGIIIKIEDADVNSNILNVSDYLVHDKDLLQIVNALINAGAEAIDINGQRIVFNSGITCIGNVIKINDEKVGTPYVISAIGLSEKLYGALTMPGGYLSLLKDTYGLKVKVERSNSVQVEKYTGVYKFEHATIDE